MSLRPEEFALPEDNEYEGIPDTESESSETTNGKPTVNDSLAALLESNRLLQQTLMNREFRKQKVYVSMPEKFDGKVSDFIEAWLEQFETWFCHREQVEGPVQECMRIETAIQNTKSDISIDLPRHEADYGQWMTWEAFSDHMKEAYGSTESGYTRFMRLHLTTQGQNDSVNAYYGRFRRMLSRQKKTMKHPDDKHLYHYMFIAGLKLNIYSEVLRQRWVPSEYNPSALDVSLGISGHRTDLVKS